MTPAQIAASLTPAQVRALKDPEGCSDEDLMEIDLAPPLLDFSTHNPDCLTDLGRAVLAELENRHD